MPEPVVPVALLAGIKQPVRVMVWPECAALEGCVCVDDGVEVLCAATVSPAMANAPQAAKIVLLIITLPPLPGEGVLALAGTGHKCRIRAIVAR
jgi:hypothetical protein